MNDTARKAIAECILSEVPQNDIYNCLAEEASELAQAALKMCRVGSKTNPTPITEKEAYNKLIEEYTDVVLIAEKILDIHPDWLIGDYKLHRWFKRLAENPRET